MTYALIAILVLGCGYALLAYLGRNAPPSGEFLFEANGWATYKVKAYRRPPPRMYLPHPGGPGPGKRRADFRRRYAQWKARNPEFETRRVYVGPTLRRHWAARIVGLTVLASDATYLGAKLL